MVLGGVAGVVVAEGAEGALAALLPGDGVVVAPDDVADDAGDAGPDGDHRKSNSDKRLRLADHKCGGFEGGPEHLAVDPFAAGVVEHGVVPGESGGELRVARGDAGPDFAADGRAHFVNVVVLEAATDRRAEAAAQVAAAEAVLVPGVGGEELGPVVGEVAARDVYPSIFQALEPGELEVEVVVGRALAGQGVVEGEVLAFLLALVGCAEGSADILAEPAGEHLVAILFHADLHGPLHGLSSA